MTEYARPFRHDALFSSYYLERLLPQDEAWRFAAAEFTQALSKLKTLHRALAKELPHMAERETEEQLIEKVFDVLGFSYVPQPPQVAGGQPDFALFASEAEKKKARKSRNELDYKLAIAISESKYWDRSLDRHRGEDDREEEKSRGEHPGVQITNYLYRTGLTWGILTNGVEWRLYHREASGSRLKNYYGVNLVELLEKGSEEEFQYFYVLFRKESFLPAGQSLLDRALEGSRLYARELGDDLKESVYKALRILSEGFFADPKATLSPSDDLELVREKSLIYLYRLLFILYAESPREGEYLLPLNNRAYKEAYSLDILKRQIVEKGAASGSPVKHTYWEHLDTLVNLVNRGSREFGIPEGEFVVPPYNGGLFATRLDPETGRDFFEAHRVPDLYLGQVIDLLARPERRGANGREFVDYSSLEIRHLGSIYEGLLEYRLRVAKEEMLAVKEERREKWVPAGEAGSRKVLDRVHAGSLYLVTDRGERKATGSYYTPDYIVKYIVENTLGPLIEEKKQKVVEKVQTLHSKVKTARGYNREAREKELRKAENQLVDEILSLKILDPAMGSGHFLVEATDYLARALVEALGGRVALENGRSGRRVADTQAPYRRAKEHEDEIRWARREVVEKCIYGVDLNPLAVELAKLSLWLSTVAKDRPLSFLDHHLRCGNSLIGARVRELAQLPLESKKSKAAKLEAAGQISTLEHIFREKVHLLLRSFELIEALPSETVEQIQKKEEYYRNFRDQVRRFQEVADVWTSLYFGNEITWDEYHVLQENLRASEAEWQEIRGRPWFRKALLLARTKGFFHWDLDFPEVFYEGAREKENPGFDVVVGNPPYGLITDAGTKSLVQQTFASVQYQPDNYVAFMERAYKLTHQHGYQSLIVPTTFLTMHYFSAIRRFLLDHCRVVTLVHFRFPVFEDPTVESANYVCQSEPDRDKRQGNIVSGIVVEGLEEFMAKRFKAQAVPQARFEEIPENDFNISLGLQEVAIVSKLLRGETEPLGMLCKIVCGLTPYRLGKGNPPQTKAIVEGRVFDANYHKDSTYRQYLMGRDFDRFAIAPLEERWISYGNWLAEPRRAAPFFEPKKIIVRQTGDSIIVTLDDQQFLNLKNVHNLRLKQGLPTYEYLLAILNSQLITYFHRQVVPEADRVFAEVKIVDLERLPIRRINFTSPEKERARLLEKGRKLYEQCLAKGDQLCVTGFVEHCLVQKPEQADVVHDLLTFLADQMIEMNKKGQTEIKAFLGWLEREIGAKIEELTNKTKIKEYHQGSFEDLLGILRANRKKLGFDPSRREFSERLKEEFDRSLAKTRPLKDRLTLTDRLIDQIVYRLYSLTEEEIKIVEGSS